MNTITVNRTKYVYAKDLFSIAPEYTKGLKTPRSIIAERGIKDDDYCYVRCVKGEYHLSNGKSNKKDLICIKLSAIEHVPEISEKLNSLPKNKINNIKCTGKLWVTKRHLKEQAKETDEKIDGVIDHEEAKLIIIDEIYKFRFEGIIINVEIRGDRRHDKIYFKISDIANSLGIMSFNNVILGTHSSYNIIEDYVFIKNEEGGKKKIDLFLTFEGLMRYFITTKCCKMRKYIKWCTEVFFVFRTAAPKIEENTARNFIGTDALAFKNIIEPIQQDISCVYLLTLGYAKNLRNHLPIYDDTPNDFIIAKYGRTNNFSRKITEYIASYGKISNVFLRVKYCALIDPLNIAEGESYIRCLMKKTDSHINFGNEMVAISESRIEDLSDVYRSISQRYYIQNSESMARIKNLEREIDVMRLCSENEIIALKKDIELLAITKNAELAAAKKDAEMAILKKDIEISKLKAELQQR